MAKEERQLICPCGSGLIYPDCCGRCHGGNNASDAEALMRSRYTAYVMKQTDHLLASWHPSSRPAILDLESPPQFQWIGLKVISHQQQDHDHATVEFVVRYKINGRAFHMQEISRFVREHGRWFYVDGEQVPR
ncbi:MAG: YchJ family metal-binding protein [Thiobacillaceae bacterium]